MAKKLPSVHPGEVLLEEFLKPMGISQNRLARETSVPPRRINEIVLGKRSISSDTALRLARYFGTSERFWLGLQVEYDLEEARNALADRLEREVKPIAPPLDMRSKNPAVSREIRQMVNRIVRRFDPERIILFGSHARGDAGPDSDVDLLIALPFSGSKHEKQVEIRLALRGIRIPKDIVVTTPEDFLWRKEVPGTIERPAALEGKLLYVRP